MAPDSNLTSPLKRLNNYCSEGYGTYVTCHQKVSVRYFNAVTGGYAVFGPWPNAE
jgi:hypothetical protein